MGSGAATDRTAHLQVIGLGPAGLGLPVAADRLGGLTALLDSGVLFAERLPEGRWRSLDYDITSNSAGADFLSGIASDGELAPVLRTREARALARAEPVPLRDAARFLSLLSRTVVARIRESTASRACFGTSVAVLRRRRDGTFLSQTASGAALCASRNVVIATGGDPLRPDIPVRLAAVPTVNSDDMLRGAHDRACARAARSGRPIVVLGGSHSAFSVAERLLRHWGDVLGEGQVHVVHRSPVALYYPEAAQALADGQRSGPLEVDPDTGEVNRFSGLRAAARAVYRDVVDGRERRVRLVRAPAPGPRSASLLVTAFGYRPRRVPVVDEETGALLVGRDGTGVDENRRVIGRDGCPVSGLYALGLRHGVTKPEEAGAREAVNVFHGDAAEQVLGQL